MGINGDVKHKLMSLHFSSIETLNKPAHILVCFFLFVVLLVWENKKKRCKKELRLIIMHREDKPNAYLVLMTTGFLCLLMICAVERGAKATASCPVLLNATHMVIVQLIYVIQGLEKKKISWLLDTDERKINVNFLTTICRQTVFVKKSFWFLFVYFVCK